MQPADVSTESPAGDFRNSLGESERLATVAVDAWTERAASGRAEARRLPLACAKSASSQPRIVLGRGAIGPSRRPTPRSQCSQLSCQESSPDTNSVNTCDLPPRRAEHPGRRRGCPGRPQVPSSLTRRARVRRPAAPHPRRAEPRHRRQSHRSRTVSPTGCTRRATPSDTWAYASQDSRHRTARRYPGPGLWGRIRMRPVAATGLAALLAARIAAPTGGRAGPCRGRRGQASPGRRGSPRRPVPG